jgi:hypothetical protein
VTEALANDLWPQTKFRPPDPFHSPHLKLQLQFRALDEAQMSRIVESDRRELADDGAQRLLEGSSIASREDKVKHRKSSMQERHRSTMALRIPRSGEAPKSINI